ncbi:hypothetical protein LCGC14_0840630 [marine sediment metagenome]|uniref:Single-stranded DNA-binding protein n=1 Tax=marine sediment metagenome TaxID=412755 RepID=A0A0F9PD99_9ZZZZ
MSNFNQVILMGNLTRDPNLSYTPGQTAVVEFGLAVNRKWTKTDGSKGEEVLFIECQCYGKRAEVISKYFEKGNPIFVQGRLKLEQWSGDDGKQHSRIRIVVENFEFIGSKKGGDVAEPGPDESSSAAG